MKTITLAGAALALAVLQAAPISAQDAAAVGAAEFNARCAVCHGEMGKGAGEVGKLLKVPPKNLTMLSKENGGVFPLERVYQSIDGSRKIAAHGATMQNASPMPIWGDYLMAKAMEDEGLPQKTAELVVLGRILSLVYYIASIQQ